MKVQVATTYFRKTLMAIVLVDDLPTPETAEEIDYRLRPFFPTCPCMFVAICDNGFAAYAPFQTHTLLALIQLDELAFHEIDLNAPPEVALPF